MGLFTRKKPVEITPEVLSQQLDECRDRVQALQRISGSLVFFLKEFPMDIPEIDTDEFKTRLDSISGNFLEDRPAQALTQAFSES